MRQIRRRSHCPAYYQYSRRVEWLIFPSMCTVETFPHNGLSLQTNLTQDEHSPQTRHTIHHKPHTTHHTLMLSEREGGKGYYSGGQEEKECMGFLRSSSSSRQCRGVTCLLETLQSSSTYQFVYTL